MGSPATPFGSQVVDVVLPDRVLGPG